MRELGRLGAESEVPVGGNDGHEADGQGRGRGGRRDGAGRPRRPELDDQILDTTVDLLVRVGYRDLRVEDLADRVGVAKSTVYRRWPSKPTLVAAAVGRLYLDQVTVPDTGDLRRDLVALLDNSFELIIAGPGRVFADLIRESGRTPELVDLITETMHARRRFYRQVLNRAIARADIPPETDTELAIDLLLGPLWFRLLITRQPISNAAVRSIVDSVLPGLIGTKDA
jgi:AcrR family transcriptional regulator